MVAQLPLFTIGSMSAPCPNQEAAKDLAIESITQLAYALNCMDYKTNHGYYKRGGDFPGDVNNDANK